MPPAGPTTCAGLSRLSVTSLSSPTRFAFSIQPESVRPASVPDDPDRLAGSETGRRRRGRGRRAGRAGGPLQDRTVRIFFSFWSCRRRRGRGRSAGRRWPLQDRTVRISFGVRRSGRCGCGGSGRRGRGSRRGPEAAGPAEGASSGDLAFGLARLNTGGPSGGSGAGFDMTAPSSWPQRLSAAAIALADCQVPAPTQVLLPCRAPVTVNNPRDTRCGSLRRPCHSRAPWVRAQPCTRWHRRYSPSYRMVMGTRRALPLGVNSTRPKARGPLIAFLVADWAGASWAKINANPARMTARRAVRYNLVAPSFVRTKFCRTRRRCHGYRYQ